MKHIITGRYGASDAFTAKLGANEKETLLELLDQKKHPDFGIYEVVQHLRKLNIYPSEIAFDLIILAVHVYAGDTRLSRDSESQDNWTREIRLIVPVSDTSKWNSSRQILTRMLNFLTGDKWEIEFRNRPTGNDQFIEPNAQLNAIPRFDSVSLFSGGLDSLVGAIDLLQGGSCPLFISHASDGTTSHAQDDCFKQLKDNYKNIDFDRLYFWLNIPSKLFKDIDSEDSTRARSFLFFSLGIFAASGIESPFTLNVPENGLIALNVPLDTLRLGALSTRTTHPFYMQEWNNLLSVLGLNGKVENKYWNKTKGEMVANCKNSALLTKMIPHSMSCSSPTKGRWQGKTTQHCGYCLPCLIRRASITKDKTTYSIPDLKAHILDSQKAEGQQIRSFQITMARLKKNPKLSNILIYKPGPLPNDPHVISELSDVYLRGMKEVDVLLSKVKTKPK